MRLFDKMSRFALLVRMTSYLMVGLDLLCSLPAQADAWFAKASFSGGARYEAVGFSIGTKGYIGLGEGKDDFWEYDPVGNTWSQKANFSGGQRTNAVGFSIGNKGYVGMGYNVGGKSDFWEYDPANNSWTQKANFGGGIRIAAVGFSIGNKGYVGTGLGTGIGGAGTYKNDFWEYNPVGNSWTQKANFGGVPRQEATGFSIGGKGYIGTGYDDGKKDDFWEYDPGSNSWTQKASFGGGVRYAAIGFSIDTKGYIGTGTNNFSNSGLKDDLWEYDPVGNSWTQKANLGGKKRYGGVGFAIGSLGYFGTGSDLSLKDDFYVFDLNALPVTLISFSGKASGEGKNVLNWSTSEEQGFSEFRVERSANAKSFETIGIVKGADGDKLLPSDYQFEDRSAGPLGYYRLKMIDLDGTYAYSRVVSVKNSDAGSVIGSVYPNPVYDKAYIDLQTKKSGIWSVTVYDMNGKQLHREVKVLPAGATRLEMPPLAKGLNVIRLENGKNIEIRKATH